MEKNKIKIEAENENLYVYGIRRFMKDRKLAPPEAYKLILNKLKEMKGFDANEHVPSLKEAYKVITGTEAPAENEA